MKHVHRVAVAAAFTVLLVACGGAAEEAVDAVDDAAGEAAEAAEEVVEEATETAEEAVEEVAETAEEAAETVEETAEEAVEEVTGGDGIAVSLTEWALDAPTSFAGGEVTFTAANDGNFPHELAIARGDSYETLPLLANGAVDEAALGADFLGRTDRIESGATADLTVTLEPGNYVLLCNIQAGPNSHAAAGQVLSVTVEG